MLYSSNAGWGMQNQGEGGKSKEGHGGGGKLAPDEPENFLST
jgi:hypothetical protein